MKRSSVAAIAVLALLVIPGMGAAVPPPAEGMLLPSIPGFPADAESEPVGQKEILESDPSIAQMVADGHLEVDGTQWFHASTGAAVQIVATSDLSGFTKGFLAGRNEQLGSSQPIPAGEDARAYLWNGVQQSGISTDELVVVRGDAIAQFIAMPGFLSRERASELVAAELPRMPETSPTKGLAFELGRLIGKLLVLALLISLPIYFIRRRRGS